MSEKSERKNRRERKSRGRGRVLEVDFTDVETREVIPEGDYLVRVKEIEEEEGPKAPYLNWILVVVDGKHKGKKLYYNTSLSKQSLWNLRAVLEAIGEEIPKSKMKLDLDSYTDKTMMVSVEVTKYRGKDKNEVVDVFSEDEEREEDTDESTESGGDDSSEEVTGKITEVGKNYITIEMDDDETLDIYIDEIDEDELPDLKEDQTVVVTGSYDGDDLIADSLEVKKAKKDKEDKKDRKKKRDKK